MKFDLKKAMESAKASLAMEGLYLTKEEEEIVSKSFDGKITHDEFIRLARELAKKMVNEQKP